MLCDPAADIAVSVQRVWKTYSFGTPADRVLTKLSPMLEWALGRPGSQARSHGFEALREVSFDVRCGETVGILGRNGSGKSTMLQVVCGILHPTRGRVITRGRIAALLELGAGFNPEFTGRENALLSGIVLGLSRAAVEARYGAIVAFAEIGEFIDRPVKTYSSGMFVRLAFAVAMAVEPDILVIDEALAVGDEAFQRKCFAAIDAFRERGGTLLFVSHNTQTVIQLCDRAILMDGGELLLDGPPKAVSVQYQRLVNLSPACAADVRDTIRCGAVLDRVESDPEAEHGSGAEASHREVANFRPIEGDDHFGSAEELLGAVQALRCGSTLDLAREARSLLETYDPTFVSASVVAYERQGAHIRDLRLLNAWGDPVTTVEMGRRYTYEYVVDFEADAENVGFGMLINSASGLGIAGATTAYHRGHVTRRAAKGSSACVRFAFVCSLLPGVYFLNAGVLGNAGGQERYLHRLLDGLMFRVCAADAFTATGLVDLGITPMIAWEPNISARLSEGATGSSSGAPDPARVYALPLAS